MFGFILRRIFASIPVMFVVTVTIFMLLRLTPGDPASVIAGDNATAEQLARIRAQLGLDLPLQQQFFDWMWRLLHADFGTSIISGTPVSTLIADRIEPTFSLALATITLSVIIAVPLGALAAARHGTWVDRAVIALSVLGFSIPVFVIGYGLIQIFAVDLRWLPVQGFRSIRSGLAEFSLRMVMPTLALTFLYVALIARITRTSLLEVLGEDYIRTARAKGISERTVFMRHALRNAAVPIITVIGIGFALLVSGVVVTESVFNLPGVGRLTIDAVLARDYPVVQAVILLSSLLYVLINLAIDVIYVLVDPRIRY
ncbi:ABC transporter permease [Bradyrhizobium sp. CCBAU 53338]|uniref:ABC transporter permease n=1 Tax=Bradyrhizobium sp. CCBAU 53338 TaxID=1325111 RepID=UPI00188B9C19|nr:ABC transporter permease [Bradyrhizobium sp. CCBAU 53338]QOZ56055.1 ABC transporter permease [Bradyrhizobium sp. CCBAU 53338]